MIRQIVPPMKTAEPKMIARIVRGLIAFLFMIFLGVCDLYMLVKVHFTESRTSLVGCLGL